MEINSWGWGGNGADFQYRVTQYVAIFCELKMHCFVLVSGYVC